MAQQGYNDFAYAVGFDPMMGFYHQPRFGRPALALDLMEPFRPLIGDSTVLSAINTRMVRPADFVVAGPAVSLRHQRFMNGAHSLAAIGTFTLMQRSEPRWQVFDNKEVLREADSAAD